jgi:SAM-dependent methyltransferase
LNHTKAYPFPENSFSKLFEHEEKNWWFQSRNLILLFYISNKIPSFSKFLEVGCGTGFVLKALFKKFPDKSFEGTEYSEEGLKYARLRLPKTKLTQRDATKMTEVECYDIIGSFDVLEHIEQDKIVLENFHTALNSIGYLILTVPQHMWLWSAVDEYSCHQRRYTRYEMLKKLRDAGFYIEYDTSFVSLLCPLMFLSRRRYKNTKQITDPMSEFKIPRLLNWFFSRIMLLEILLLKFGVRFPFGGSLLVIAKKIAK